MTNPKRSAQKRNAAPAAGEPEARRPQSPGPAYGVPKAEKGLLPWTHVAERMVQAHVYWVCTVDGRGRPHATPVDGLWLDDRLYFGGSPDTRRQRNLAANPAVCIHLESGTDVLILRGEARPLTPPGRDLARRLSAASAQKYGYGPKPEDYETGSGTYVFRPRTVFAWQAFPKDVTRWTLREGE